MEESREGGVRGGHSRCGADGDALSRMEEEKRRSPSKKKKKETGKRSLARQKILAPDGNIEKLN